MPTRAKIALLARVDHWALSKLKENVSVFTRFGLQTQGRQ